ncbi:hypothetical protein AArcMg_0126 [Natrarchaeobaculum sulfurireducens]|uniref:Uncharacterized protein n=1 Tax=Natrarchaeobaculum sulfurireducens TaxID=2044521 RepID=A0A346PKW3_9EURY|nr:hypothetical protein AArcMg_0126 [Natrarchaeobaculum sulfurireducens]
MLTSARPISEPRRERTGADGFDSSRSSYSLGRPYFSVGDTHRLSMAGPGGTGTTASDGDDRDLPRPCASVRDGRTVG